MEAVSFAANSFEGRRKRNEDQIGVLQIEENTWFLGLADGMGGPGNGEIASNMVIETAREVVLDAFNQRRRVPLKRILSKIYLTAYQRIRDEIEMKPYLSGMGSTLVSVLIHDGEMVWGNMGDSRLYLLRSGFVMQLTKYHTKLQQQLDSRSVRRKIYTLDGN
ncbi:partial Serine/threonine phosphatase stp, partial [Methylococcales bacterium]